MTTQNADARISASQDDDSGRQFITSDDKAWMGGTTNDFERCFIFVNSWDESSDTINPVPVSFINPPEGENMLSASIADSYVGDHEAMITQMISLTDGEKI